MIFLFDECLVGFATGLIAAGEPVETVLDHFEPSTDDSIIFEHAGATGKVIVSQDRFLKSHERAMIVEHSVGVIVVRSHGMTRHERQEQLSAAWPRMKTTCAKTEPPFLFSVHRDGRLHRLPLPRGGGARS